MEFVDAKYIFAFVFQSSLRSHRHPSQSGGECESVRYRVMGCCPVPLYSQDLSVVLNDRGEITVLFYVCSDIKGQISVL